MDEEQVLITQARQNSDAFETLFQRYLPMVRRALSQYYRRDYDQDDWLQEARIALIRALNHFDPKQGSRFGAYYKLVLNTHLRSQIRHYLAQKRRIDAQAIVMETPPEQVKALNVAKSVNPEQLMLMRASLEEFSQLLSHLEARVIRESLDADFSERNNRAYQRAVARTKAKFEKIMLRDS